MLNAFAHGSFAKDDAGQEFLRSLKLDRRPIPISDSRRFRLSKNGTRILCQSGKENIPVQCYIFPVTEEAAENEEALRLYLGDPKNDFPDVFRHCPGCQTYLFFFVTNASSATDNGVGSSPVVRGYDSLRALLGYLYERIENGNRSTLASQAIAEELIGVLAPKDLRGYVEVYEFPFQFKSILEEKIGETPDMHEDYLQTTTIRRSDNSKFDPQLAQCKVTFPSKFGSPNQQLHLRNQSCDPLHFEMAERSYDYLKTYVFSNDAPVSSSLRRSLVEMGYRSDSLFTQLMVEIFSMPEPTLPSYFISSDSSDDSVFHNANLVAPTVKAQFIPQLATFLEQAKADLRATSDGSVLLGKIAKAENIFRQRYPNVDDMSDVRVELDFQFMRKLPFVGVKDKTRVCFFGDVHSSVHTLCRAFLRLNEMGVLSEFRIVDPDTHFIFLGDMTDRSLYGPEVFFLVMKLKETNPRQVFVNKGNHEDYSLSSRYGFRDEISCKILNQCSKQTANRVHFDVAMIWMYMPVAHFLPVGEARDEFVQFCHGGFVEQVSKVKTFLHDRSSSVLVVDADQAEEVLWSDFRCGRENFKFANQSRGGGTKVYTAEFALEYMETAGIVALIRGHQESFDNTKLISARTTDTCSDPVAWEEFLRKSPERFAPYLPQSADDIYSVRFPVPQLDDLPRISDEFFTPVYTMTTAISARSMDADGFGRLVL